MTLLSQREFAEHIGRSHVWVNRLIKQGKIPVVDGKIPLEEGVKAYEASKQVGYEANRAHGEKQRQEAAKKKEKASGASSATKKKKREMPPTTTIPGDDETMPMTGNVAADKVAAAFNKAKLAEKTYQAKIKELDYKEKQGLLIAKETVEADAAQTAEELRGLMFSIPPRIAPLCEGRPAREIESIIDEAINEALGALKKSRFVKR